MLNPLSRFRRQREFLRELVAEGARMERLATGFRFVEGPIWIPEENCLLFSDIPANRIYKLNAEHKVEIFRAPSHNSNGLTLDRQNQLLICEHSGRRVSRLLGNGTLETLAGEFNDGSLNSPNDIVVKSDGAIYFTDPLSDQNRGKEEQTVEGVYRLNTDGALALVANDFARPNGLAFSPDERILYIGDSSPRSHIRAFDVQSDGTLAHGRIFQHLPGDKIKGASPDGIKVDVAGNVYCAARGGVRVFSPGGDHLGTIEVPEQPANCAWGDADRRSLYIAARTSIYRMCLKQSGAGTA